MMREHSNSPTTKPLKIKKKEHQQAVVSYAYRVPTVIYSRKLREKKRLID